jgi:hypothetical protein
MERMRWQGRHPHVALECPQGFAIDIDVDIAPLIAWIWSLGVETRSCCQRDPSPERNPDGPDYRRDSDPGCIVFEDPADVLVVLKALEQLFASPQDADRRYLLGLGVRVNSGLDGIAGFEDNSRWSWEYLISPGTTTGALRAPLAVRAIVEFPHEHLSWLIPRLPPPFDRSPDAPTPR